MLSIQKHIIEHGLDATVAKFKLSVKDYPHKVLLKYQQIESPMSEPEVQDARGLVLKKSDWSVMSLAFRKFFNLGEGKGEELDWSTAKIFEKMDGTLVHVYYDTVLGKVCFGTTGTAEGEGDVDNFHWSPDMESGKINGTFADLFWKAFLDTTDAYYKENPRPMYRMGGDDPGPFLQKEPPDYSNKEQAFVWFGGFTLAFELCTPHNIVVTPHSNFRVYLLGARNLKTMEEVGFDKLQQIAKSIGVYMPRTFDITSPDELMVMVAKQPFSMEGIVACDANFNRRKLKNPAYVSVHFMRDATAYWRIVDVVRSGEIDEYLVYFPGRKEEVMDMKRKWDDLNATMAEAAEAVRPYADAVKSRPPEAAESKVARRDAAKFIMEISKDRDLDNYKGFFFAMLGPSKTPEPDALPSTERTLSDFLMMCDGRDMYADLKKRK